MMTIMQKIIELVHFIDEQQGNTCYTCKHFARQENGEPAPCKRKCQMHTFYLKEGWEAK